MGASGDFDAARLRVDELEHEVQRGLVRIGELEEEVVDLRAMVDPLRAEVGRMAEALALVIDTAIGAEETATEAAAEAEMIRHDHEHDADVVHRGETIAEVLKRRDPSAMSDEARGRPPVAPGANVLTESDADPA